MNFKQSFRLAVKSLTGSKMRAFLTMLGVIIGVASVIVLVSLVNGMSGDITSQFESMGTNLISVNVMGRGGNRQITVDEMERIVEENPRYYAAMSPVVNASATVKNGTESASSSITGVGEDYLTIKNVELQDGRFIRFIDTERRQKVCVIGTYLAETLFPGTNPVGQSMKINGSTYSVVGLLTETADSTESSTDDVAYIPYSTATRLAGSSSVSSYSLSAADTDTVEEAVTLMKNELYNIFGDEDAYRVSSQSAMIEQVNEMTGMMTAVLVGIAGISLVVGGIGIMNIMLVSVTERTREIGIRKSLGAKRKDIMRQFVIEAATTSSLGGVIGIVLGIAMAYAAGVLMDMSVSPSLNAILLAFSVSVAIGMIFGYFPANKAAKLNPIDALRYD